MLAEWGVITLGTAIVAAAVFFFLVPSRLSVGSVSGLAIVLANFIPLPVSAITMALNVLFLVLGFLLIGGEFGAKTVYTSILLPLLLGVLERLFPNNGSIMGDQFLDMLCYTMLVSLGLALLFVRNASSGGLDIAAKILNLSLIHIYRYDVEGMAPEQFRQAVPVVFSEPQLDDVHTAIPEGSFTVFATEYLPGQFDQRAASAAECVGLLFGGERPAVATARVFLLSGLSLIHI